jgi:hypothetical protein
MSGYLNPSRALSPRDTPIRIPNGARGANQSDASHRQFESHLTRWHRTAPGFNILTKRPAHWAAAIIME